MVFNANNWEVVNWVEVDLKAESPWTEVPGIYQDEAEILSEVLEQETNAQGKITSAKVGFIGSAPGLGMRVFKTGERKREPRNQISVNENRVSTPLFDLEVDPDTGILQVFDHKGQTLLSGNEVIIDEEVGDLYFHKSSFDEPIKTESGGGKRFGAFKTDGFSIEQYPLRTIINYQTSYYAVRWPYYLTEKFGGLLYRQKSIEISKKIIVYEHLPRIDFVTSLDTKQSHVRIRLKFDSHMVAPHYTRQTQFGAIELPRARTLESGVKVPSLSWVNCQESDRGLNFLTLGVPINEIKGGEIYLTLLRSVSMLSADGVSGPFDSYSRSDGVG